MSNVNHADASIATHDALIWLFVYRLSLALVLSLILSYPQAAPWLGSNTDWNAARLVLIVQGASVLLSGLSLLLHWPPPPRQIELAAFLDILMYTTLMHVSGGVSTGLGLILALVVIAAAILMQGRLSLLFASLATLAVISQQLYAELNHRAVAGSYTLAGLLGLTYFAVALLAHVLARRLRETEHLAARREVDIADLSTLNESIIQSMSTGVLAINCQRQLLLINSAARRLLSAPQAAAGAVLHQFAPQLHHWLDSALAHPRPTHPPLLIGEHEVAPSVRQLGTGDSSPALLIFIRDHRELMRQAQEIKLASLGRLTASIAHNIRNPLSSINHASQLLAEASDRCAEDQQLLAIVRRNVIRIDETVTSVLELSRRDPPRPQPIALAAWLHEFGDDYRLGHGCAPDSLEIMPPPAPVEVWLDPRHFGQILRNLCDNAFKHGAVAGEPPQVRLIIEPSDGQSVSLLVIDQGPGVAADDIQVLFDPFFTTSNTGVGLGLYVARELAQANGLGLDYVHRQHGGACFRLTMPTAAAHRERII